jgi:rubrerythrin
MPTFNADEVFEMAIRMERNGAAFYRRAADLHARTPSRDTLLGLAAMEDEHERLFTDMRRNRPKQPVDATAFDPDAEGPRYLDALAGGSGTEGSETARANLTGRESLADILAIAIGLEKNAILFYLGLKDLVANEADRHDVQTIINEEKGHVVTLTTALRTLKEV